MGAQSRTGSTETVQGSLSSVPRASTVGVSAQERDGQDAAPRKRRRVEGVAASAAQVGFRTTVKYTDVSRRMQ